MSYEQLIKDSAKTINELDKRDPFAPDNGRIKVLYAEPSGGLVDAAVFDNRKDFFMELSKWKHHSKFDFLTCSTGRMHTSYAREILAEEALKLNTDFILFIDDDMMVPKDMFPHLMKHADKADIIAPLCFQRIPPYNPVLYKLNYDTDKNGTITCHSDNITDYPINATFNPDAVGFGVVLIKTEVLKKLPKPWFFSNTALGEDIYFCLRAKQMGFKTLVDTRIKIGHMANPHCVTELDFIRYNKEHLKKLHPEEMEKHQLEMKPLVEVVNA